MIVSERRLWNKTTTEARFYLSSLSSNAEKIAGAIRSHWGIENSLHWTLDVTFSKMKADSQTKLSRKFCTSTS
jgi:predicted transposase YbfD/YdcC